jgi:peptidyl-prolyl cis-trans isomerase C
MPLLREGPDSDPHFNYHLLRNALEAFSRNPAALDAQQYRRVLDRAKRSYRLESRVLASSEARGLLIPEAQLNAAVAEVASRYAEDGELATDLAANGLDPPALRRALWRELMFDAVMQRVGSKAADVNEIDLRLFYEVHRDRFETPERRTARHILVSINADFADNTRAAARARVERLAGHLKGSNKRFQDLARRHSECPTAMEGGLLGEIKRGVLYPELDAVLFCMAEGEVSGIVESEMGFHILACEKIEPARQIPFAVAAGKIRDILQQRRRRNCQKAWLATLDDTQR